MNNKAEFEILSIFVAVGLFISLFILFIGFNEGTQIDSYQFIKIRKISYDPSEGNYLVSYSIEDSLKVDRFNGPVMIGNNNSLVITEYHSKYSSIFNKDGHHRTMTQIVLNDTALSQLLKTNEVVI